MSPAVPDPRRWWTLVVLCFSLLVIALDNTILNVALPTLQRDLDASASDLQWIVDSYMRFPSGRAVAIPILIFFFRIMLFPSTDMLTIGNS